MQKVVVYNLLAVLLFSGIAFAIARSIVRPIQALSLAARRIADGSTDVTLSGTSTSAELRLLTETFNRMASRLRRNRIALRESQEKIEEANGKLRFQNEELQRLNEALEHLSITDGLTRLYNHRFFQEQMTQEIARVERSGGTLSLVLVDIDNFKQLNDNHGHSVGDQVLRHVASLMSGLVRESDVLARYGGEEFALLLAQADLDEAARLAEKLRLAISQSPLEIESESRPLQVTVSIGVSAYQGDRKAFFNDADRALYRAKESGKDCVMVE